MPSAYGEYSQPQVRMMDERITIVAVSVAFAVGMAPLLIWVYGWTLGSVAAPAAGIAFGIMTYRFAQSGRLEEQTELQLQPGEELHYGGKANHWSGWESVGGRLYLTDRRLVFRSHRYNLDNHEWSIGVGEIEAVDTYNSLWLFPNGLVVRISGRDDETFVVNDRPEWVVATENVGASR